VLFARYLLDEYGYMFTSSGEFTGTTPPLRLFGFNIRRFVKIWAMECFQNDVKLPHALWYGAEHRDAEAVVLPTPEGKDMNLKTPLMMLGLAPAGVPYTTGESPVRDAEMAAKIAVATNLFPMFPKLATFDKLEELCKKRRAAPRPKGEAETTSRKAKVAASIVGGQEEATAGGTELKEAAAKRRRKAPAKKKGKRPT
jgi:hypothetical protein